MDLQTGQIDLSRRVRFCVNPAVTADEWLAAERSNSFAAWPGMVGLGSFFELDVCCRGMADPVTGYLVNISAIDEHVRRSALPVVHASMRRDLMVEPSIVLRSMVEAMRPAMGEMLASVRWFLTPYHSITMKALKTDRVILAQQFEFAAAHRLHVDALSVEENRTIFGRCNNPHSHGHNYRLEVAVEASLTNEGARFSNTQLERMVNERIIERFDHTNLNVDVPEFANMNPSVENIAKVCYELLRDAVAASGGAELSHVTVWETAKTSCTYRG